MEIKISEVQHGSLRLVRKCRVVTYVMGTDDKGREEVVCEVDDYAANELLGAIATAQVVTQ
jgi:hypothetical protein